MPVEGLLLGAGIGIILGVVGAGGAILAVPGLIAVLGLSPIAATSSSLVIVAAGALTGAWTRRKTSGVDIRLALTFSALGVVGTFAGTRLLLVIAEEAIPVIFAVLMFGAAIAMWRGPSVASSDVHPSNLKMFVVASGVGVLTGLLGVGGGFLIVPALVLILGVPMGLATGTSLLAIALNSTIALGMRYETWDVVPWAAIVGFSAAAVISSVLVAPLARRLPSRVVQKLFAGLIVVVATYLLTV